MVHTMHLYNYHVKFKYMQLCIAIIQFTINGKQQEIEKVGISCHTVVVRRIRLLYSSIIIMLSRSSVVLLF